MRPEYLIPVVGYFLGSIPFGFILVKASTGTDIRKAGSGNIGATNAFRKNHWIGILTFLLDAGKGYLAVLAAGWLGGDVKWQAAAALASILGHVFTVFLGFKGGRGVAVGFGSYLALTPWAVCTTMIVFFLTLLLARYVSLASILATAAFPLWVYLYRQPSIAFWAAVIGSALIIAKHHQNIRRLLLGTESKFGRGSRSG
jgi:glycerol-3-phosphate acyltransferase PlsY